MALDRIHQLETALRNLLSWSESAVTVIECEFGSGKTLGEMARDDELPWQIADAQELLSESDAA